MILLKWS